MDRRSPTCSCLPPPIPPWCPSRVTSCSAGEAPRLGWDSPYSHANCPPPSPWQAAFVWGHLEGLRKGHRETLPRPPCTRDPLVPGPTCACQVIAAHLYRGSGRSPAPFPPGISPVGRHFQAEGHLEVHELLPVLQHPGDLHPQALLLLLQGLHRQLRGARGGVRGTPALPEPCRSLRTWDRAGGSAHPLRVLRCSF